MLAPSKKGTVYIHSVRSNSGRYRNSEPMAKTVQSSQTIRLYQRDNSRQPGKQKHEGEHREDDRPAKQGCEPNEALSLQAAYLVRSPACGERTLCLRSPTGT